MKRCQSTLAILVVLYASIALAEDFKTVTGKEYKNVTVSRVESDGIVLKSKAGISKVYFTELPKDVQERFGYDPERATIEAARAAEKATKEAIARSWQKIGVTPDTVEPAAKSGGAALEQRSLPPAKWTYSEQQDEMGRGTTKLAQVVSSNTVSFGFPYRGETHAALQLRKDPKYVTKSNPSGQDVMVRVERGQFVSSYTKNFVTVRFDDGELWKFDIVEPEDGATGLLFMRPAAAEDFINELRKAKSLKIEADFFEEGPRVFEFDVRGLNW